MKRLALAVILILIAGSALAQTWHTADQTTVSWELVTKAENGTVITVGEVVYDLWITDATTPVDLRLQTRIVESVLPPYTYTHTTEGTFFVGVQSVRTLDGEVISKSEIAWSDDPLVVLDGNTFGLRYFLPPGKITNLRIGD